jgi:hypothetical protein
VTELHGENSPQVEAENVDPTRLQAKPDIGRPPKRLPIRLKNNWLSLAEPVREDIVAREAEVEKSFKRYEGLGNYAIEAEKNGRTIAAAVTDYAQVETKFRSDPIEAPMYVWARLGLDPAAMATAFADRFLPDAPKQAYEAGRLAGFEEGRIAGSIQQFAVTHSDFELYRQKMAALQAADPSQTLEQLYDAAKWADPLAREQEIAMRVKMTPNQLRNNGQTRFTQAERSRMAGKATLGSPSTSSVPQRKFESAGDAWDDVRASVARQKGG